jgi:hypothetical protein
MNMKACACGFATDHVRAWQTHEATCRYGQLQLEVEELRAEVRRLRWEIGELRRINQNSNEGYVKRVAERDGARALATLWRDNYVTTGGVGAYARFPNYRLPWEGKQG